MKGMELECAVGGPISRLAPQRYVSLRDDKAEEMEMSLRPKRRRRVVERPFVLLPPKTKGGSTPRPNNGRCAHHDNP